jgi:orotidine-5'-phosphate decarboxylase
MNSKEYPGNRIITALDFPSIEEARAVTRHLEGVTRFKIGKQLNVAVGTPKVLEATGSNVFLDLKFHDIPNTVAEAVYEAGRLNVRMLNMHCQGGRKMMEAAVAAANRAAVDFDHRPLLLGVTVLTSLDDGDLKEMGATDNVKGLVRRLAIMAHESGLDGIVCSGADLDEVVPIMPPGFLFVTPGIRSSSDPADDQKRTMTAREAILRGATHLVIGRPITRADDPVAAAEGFIAEVEAALKERVAELDRC